MVFFSRAKLNEVLILETIGIPTQCLENGVSFHFHVARLLGDSELENANSALKAMKFEQEMGRKLVHPYP